MAASRAFGNLGFRSIVQTQVTCARGAAYSSDNRVGSAYEDHIRGLGEKQFPLEGKVEGGLELPPVQQQHLWVIESGAQSRVGAVQVAQNLGVGFKLGRE